MGFLPERIVLRLIFIGSFTVVVNIRRTNQLVKKLTIESHKLNKRENESHVLYIRLCSSSVHISNRA
jgi:hypothetical protein